MYGLRKMNNLYKEHAGSRGDFIIVGHPEWQIGKVKADIGLKQWDETLPKSHPAKSAAADRLRRNGTAALLKRLTQDFPSSPRERTLAKKKASSSTSSMERLTGTVAPLSDREAFDEFLQMVSSPSSRLALQPHGTPIVAGSGNDLKHSGICRHYDSLTEQLEEISQRLRRDPERVKAELLHSGSWRYWARQLELADAQKGKERHVKRLAHSHTQQVLSLTTFEPGRAPIMIVDHKASKAPTEKPGTPPKDWAHHKRPFKMHSWEAPPVQRKSR